MNFTRFATLIAAVVLGIAGAAIPARAADACCVVVSIDIHSGLATAKVNANGQQFEFRLDAPVLLQHLQLGQRIYANLQTRLVSLDGQIVVGQIVSISPPPIHVAFGAGSTALSGAAEAPTSSIVSIDSRAGIVTAKVNATGQQFQFRLNNPAQLPALRVGQPIYPNFGKKLVSLDGQHATGTILHPPAASLQPQPGLGAPAGSASQKSENAAQSPTGVPSQRPEQLMYVRVVDPCSVVTDKTELKQFAGAGLSQAFPFSSNDGPYTLTAYDPHLASVTCSPLHVWLDTRIHFKRTDVLHFETSGTMTFDTIVLGHVISTAPPSQPITSANFHTATICFSDIHVDSFNLTDVPSAVDNWIRKKINERVTDKKQCRDVTAQIAAYLALGGAIPPAQAANSPANAGGPRQTECCRNTNDPGTGQNRNER